MSTDSMFSNETDIREELLSFVEHYLAQKASKQLDEAEIEGFVDFSQELISPEILYNPRPELITRLEAYNKWQETRSDEDAGELMEELAFLAFTSLRGCSNFSSYRSFDAQLDLVVSGSDLYWRRLMELLHLPHEGRVIVIEAKNTNNPVSNTQFLRLCAIVQHKLIGTCQLGVFFTRMGASGFDEVLFLSNARASQVLFHVATQNYVIVLDNTDIQQLAQRGSLPRILEDKIRDVEEGKGKGTPTEDTDTWVPENVLPPHLLKYQTRKITD